MGIRGLFEGWHIVILVLVIVVVFGWKRLPDAARSLGRSARILKSEVDGMTKSDASGQTVPGEKAEQTQGQAQQPGSVPGEAPANSNQQPQSSTPEQQGYQAPQNAQGQPAYQPPQHSQGATAQPQQPQPPQYQPPTQGNGGQPS